MSAVSSCGHHEHSCGGVVGCRVCYHNCLKRDRDRYEQELLNEQRHVKALIGNMHKLKLDVDYYKRRVSELEAKLEEFYRECAC